MIINTVTFAVTRLCTYCNIHILKGRTLQKSKHTIYQNYFVFLFKAQQKELILTLEDLNMICAG